jgi:hypothetical protein
MKAKAWDPDDSPEAHGWPHCQRSAPNHCCNHIGLQAGAKPYVSDIRRQCYWRHCGFGQPLQPRPVEGLSKSQLLSIYQGSRMSSGPEDTAMTVQCAMCQSAVFGGGQNTSTNMLWRPLSWVQHTG